MDETNDPGKSLHFSESLKKRAEEIKHQLEEIRDEEYKLRLESSQKLLESGSEWIEFLTSKPFQDKKDEITQLKSNTSGAEAKMRFLTKELFEMVLDMTITDVTESLHYEWSNVTTKLLPSTNDKESDERMTGAGQDQVEKLYENRQEKYGRRVMFRSIASDLLSQARTSMETRIQQLKERASNGLSRGEISDEDVKGASQDETVTASTA